MTPDVQAECIKRLQTIMDHFTNMAEREEFKGWKLDERGRYVMDGVKKGAKPASFWHDSELHNRMNGNDPSCEVYLAALWVKDRLEEMK